MIPGDVTTALKRSGFPLQTRIVRDIAANSRSGWSVAATEWPWRDPVDDRDRFLDIAASKQSRDPDDPRLRALIEVKKAQRALIFLRPVGYQNTPEREFRFRCLVTIGRDESRPATPRVFCLTTHLDAPSIDGELCIVAKGSGQRQSTELLEADASLLVRGATAYAQAERIAARGLPVADTVYIPILVTTASLYSARYDPAEVSLETGEFDEAPKEIREERWVRFTKAFAGAEGKRSLFVVGAKHLGALLAAVRVTSFSEEDVEEVHLPLGEHLRDLGRAPSLPSVPIDRRYPSAPGEGGDGSEGCF